MQLIHFVLGTPACSPSEGGRGGGGGLHSCPWSAGETPAPTASGWWVGPGGNGERTSCSLAIVCAASAADTGARQDLGLRTAEEGGEEQGGGGA